MSMHGKRTQRLLGDEGFALVAVLMLLIGLSALAAAGYVSSNTDYRITQNHRASQRAFYVADAGLEHFMGQGKLPKDTVTYNHPDGTVQVWATQVVSVDDSSTLYQLTSVGTHSPPEGGVSTRELHTIVLHKAAGFAVNAAITAPAGLEKNGISGSVDGDDNATAGDCPVGGKKNVAGLEVPPSGFTMNGGGTGKKGGSPPGFSGNPAIDSTKTPTQMFQDMGINGALWQSLRDGTFAEADYVVSTDGYPTFGTDVAADEWPVIVIDQSSYGINPAQSGRGTLIVYGDLAISGSFSWDGLILVGGEVTSNGNNQIMGSVIAGLNLLLGSGPDEVDLGNGNWNYAYHSCNVLNALKGIGWPVEEPGTWYEKF